MRKIIFRGRRINSSEWVRGGVSPTALKDGGAERRMEWTETKCSPG